MASSSQVKIKIEDVCRTCLAKESELFSVFDVSLGAVTLDCAIADVTGVKIERSDGLPFTVCQICKEKASKAFEFRKLSREANTTLQNVYKKEKNELSYQENTSYQETDPNIKTEQPTADDGDYVDWIGLDDFNDVDAVKDERDDIKFTESRTATFQCKNCNLVFQSSKKLQEHTSKNCLKVEFDDTCNNYCPLCGTSYRDAVNLTTHMWENHADLMGPKKRGRPKKILTTTILTKLSENGFRLKAITVEKYDCMICKEECNTKEELGVHLVRHKDTKVMCCLLCKKMYLKARHFSRHICTEKGNNKKEDDLSTIAGKNKQSCVSEILLEELLEPNGITENCTLLQVCEICSGVFTSEEDLMSHNDAEHPERSLRCNLCLKVFASIKSAARHRSICKQIERKHKCTTCGLKFAYEISLNKHILRYHEGQSVSVKFMDTKAKDEEKQYQCDTCSKQFSRKELLVKHTRTHSDKLYECDICKKKFNRSDNLRSHKKTHDPREKSKASTCLCLYCGRSFNNSSNLIVHMRRHTGEKPYKCDFCGKGFPRSSDLQCHRRSHTGEKPCVCRICGKGFSRSNKLSRHMRVHTGVKPYKCTYCEKAFSQSNDLTLHIRRHTGDKPYICEVCGDRFIQGTALHNHRRTHGHYPPPAAGASPDAQAHVIRSTNDAYALKPTLRPDADSHVLTTFSVQNITHPPANQ
ncbi:zinc finger protein 260-like [Ostrinia furnacalis]|uniref:zinc finger protein 260-like n=1 Tax=Ostrinia furnacalis TaxID=93504 RepID=UPI00103C6ABA|nr:zinc finger protein 260-like [Ostrinia furnacalis]